MWSKLTVKENIVFVLFAGDPSNRAWLRVEVQLNLGSPFRVGFEGIVGGDDKTDIALDDISFSAGCYKVQIKCSEQSYILRCFDTVSRRPYRCFSIALKVILSFPDRHKIFTGDLI